MKEFAGEKTEQPTPRRLEDAQKRGQIARSAEVQTVFVLLAVVCAFSFTGREIWREMSGAVAGTLGHLHGTPLTINAMQGYAFRASLVLIQCVAPILIAAMVGGLLAGGIQNRFNTASEALGFHWERLDVTKGIQRIFSGQSLVPAALAIVKFALIFGLTLSTIKEILSDPVFTSSVGLARFAEFLAASALKISLRVLLAVGVIAAADYSYQFWRTSRDLMMTKEELKEEMKHTEGNPLVKSRRRKVLSLSRNRVLAEIPKADVVVTNPTHIAVALRYDRNTMHAPRLVAKGIRKNAEQIREIARQYGVPIVENKPLARLMYKYGKVGREIPAQLYAAVAEVLAYVYRMNPYRYYADVCNATATSGEVK